MKRGFTPPIRHIFIAGTRDYEFVMSTPVTELPPPRHSCTDSVAGVFVIYRLRSGHLRGDRETSGEIRQARERIRNQFEAYTLVSRSLRGSGGSLYAA